MPSIHLDVPSTSRPVWTSPPSHPARTAAWSTRRTSPTHTLPAPSPCTSPRIPRPGRAWRWPLKARILGSSPRAPRSSNRAPWRSRSPRARWGPDSSPATPAAAGGPTKSSRRGPCRVPGARESLRNVRAPAPAGEKKSFFQARAKKVVEKRAFHRGKWRCRVNPLRSSRSSACFQTATLLKSRRIRRWDDESPSVVSGPLFFRAKEETTLEKSSLRNTWPIARRATRVSARLARPIEFGVRRVSPTRVSSRGRAGSKRAARPRARFFPTSE